MTSTTIKIEKETYHKLRVFRAMCELVQNRPMRWDDFFDYLLPRLEEIIPEFKAIQRRGNRG